MIIILSVLTASVTLLLAIAHLRWVVYSAEKW